MKNIVVVLLLLFFPTFIFSQVIEGKVVDEKGVALIGANVKNTTLSTSSVTDLDGAFKLKANPGDNLVVSMIGYATKNVKASSNMNIVMSEESNTLTEVVVIGYGTAKKRDLAGSIVRVEGKQVADKPNSNPIASLQGKVTGLSVVNTGKPGDDPDIRIRGTISRYQTKPLYVVDGIWNDNISFINPNDIESMEVLKDPSSLAIFGVRGANGVIIVTTKKAKSGKTTVNYNSSVGFKSITGKPSLVNGKEFKMLYAEQRANQGDAPYSYFNLFNGNTDWVDLIANDNAFMSTNNLSISNATDKNKFYLGLGYLTDQGLINYEEYKKFTFNLNDELQLSNTIKVGAGISGSDSRLPQFHSFNSALNATPIVDAYNPIYGVYNQLPSEIGGAQVGNPLLEVEGKKYTQLNRGTRFVANVFTEIKLLKDLKLRAAYLADLGFNKGRGYRPVFDVYAAETDEVTLYGSDPLTSVNQFSNNTQNIQEDLLLTYNKTFGKHNITAMFGNTRYQEDYSAINGTVKQYLGGNAIPNDPRWWYLNVYPFGDPTTKLSNSDEWDRSTISYLGRVLYNFDGKYILNGSFRRDGSSEIRDYDAGKANWQNFWSVGAAWEISKEAFMDNQKIFDLLKIKASTGVLGNQYAAIHYPSYPNYTTGSSAVFGESLVPAYVLAYKKSPNLKWETVKSSEVGIETASFQNRLKFDVNYYNKTTDNLLNFVEYGTQKFYINAGSINNKGFEFSAVWNSKTKGNVEYSFGGNLTTLKNEVTSVYTDGYEVFDNPSVFRVGAPMGSFYGYEVEGVYQSYADILASAPSTLGSYGPGDLKYRDINGDGKITPDDRKVIGNPSPDFTYGLSGSITYKNFSLSVDVQGVYGNEVWRDWGNGANYAQFNYRSDRLDRWTGAGTSNWEPRVNDGSGYNNLPSTYMIEDGSYIRLRNIQLGYNFNAKFLNKMNIQSLRMYVNAQNLVTYKHTSGFTPEAGGTPTRFGVDDGGYPVPAITTFGINVTF